MKFNKLIFMLMFALITAMVVGCSSGTDTEAPQKVTQENTETVSEGQEVTLPEDKPTLIGKVKNIVGNEITVFKAEVSQNEGAPNEGAPQEKPANQTQNQDNQSERPQNRGFDMKFTEETETFMIPVGTPIVTMQRGTEEANQVELTEINKDTILRIWEKDGTVSYVQVMGGSSTMGNKQGTDEQGPEPGGGMPPDMGGGPPGMGS